MVQALTKLLTCAEFIFQYGNNPRYELADGEVIDIKPIGLDEAVGGKLATELGIAITHAELPWFMPRTCLICPFAETATARRPDIVVLDETVLHHEPLGEFIKSTLLPSLQLGLDDIMPRNCINFS